MSKIQLIVACALIDIDGRVLIAERPETKQYGGYWEFPGGKVEQGETPEAAIIRELKEELNIDTAQNCLAPLNFSSGNYDNIHTLMTVYICRRWQGIMQPMLSQRLKWVSAKKLKEFKMPPADIPLIPNLIDILP